MPSSRSYFSSKTTGEVVASVRAMLPSLGLVGTVLAATVQRAAVLADIYIITTTRPSEVDRDLLRNCVPIEYWPTFIVSKDVDAVCSAIVLGCDYTQLQDTEEIETP